MQKRTDIRTVIFGWEWSCQHLYNLVTKVVNGLDYRQGFVGTVSVGIQFTNSCSSWMSREFVKDTRADGPCHFFIRVEAKYLKYLPVIADGRFPSIIFCSSSTLHCIEFTYLQSILISSRVIDINLSHLNVNQRRYYYC